MKITLREWDWDAQAFVEREYPWAALKSFVDDLRLGNRWRENPEVVFNRFMKLERELTAARNEVTRAAAALVCNATTKAGNPCKGRPLDDGLCVAHQPKAVRTIDLAPNETAKTDSTYAIGVAL